MAKILSTWDQGHSNLLGVKICQVNGLKMNFYVEHMKIIPWDSCFEVTQQPYITNHQNEIHNIVKPHRHTFNFPSRMLACLRKNTFTISNLHSFSMRISVKVVCLPCKHFRNQEIMIIHRELSIDSTWGKMHHTLIISWKHHNHSDQDKMAPGHLLPSADRQYALQLKRKRLY